MLRLLYLLGLTMTYLSGSDTRKVEILKPIRATGNEVGLIFPDGEFFKGENYKKTAEAIQAASELRVWVALNARYYRSFAGLYRTSRLPQEAIDALQNAGMTSQNFVGVAHGIETRSFLAGVRDSELKAVILLGSFIPRGDRLQDFPVPVLTLAAELDGVARMSRMAEEFAKLKDDIQESFSNIYRTPVLVLEGVNHAQFASGALPYFMQKYDLIPDVTEEDAHRMIGEHVNDFLTATFSTAPLQADNALRNLKIAFSKSVDKFQPFLDVKALGNVSRWTILAQEHIAGKFANQIQVANTVEKLSTFHFSEPSIQIGGGSIVVNTKTLEETRSFDPPPYFGRESLDQLDVKLKSKNAIWDAITAQGNGTQVDGPLTSLKGEPATCKSLNELALEVALNHSTKEARDRYKTRGQSIILEEDLSFSNRLLWAVSALDTWKNGQSLYVKSMAYSTPVTGSWNPGMLYCKLITPYRVMEWINIDSLKMTSKMG